MNQLLARVFQERGYTSDFFEQHFLRRHALPKDTDTLCKALDDYRIHHKFLVIYTDFDMDGICAGIIALAGLSELGFRAGLFFPDVSAYGFASSDVDAILRQYPQASGILTGDVGITAQSAISYARSKGLDVFVTDHHLQKQTALPATVTVDPNRLDDFEGYSGICGANVMYQVLRHYATHYMESAGYYANQIDRLRVFAGLGTISDGMPLYCENRPLVRDAVSICRMLCPKPEFGVKSASLWIEGTPVYRLVFQGLSTMFLAFIEAGKLLSPSDITETFFAYYVAPAFNALKRMGVSVQLAYDVFFDDKKSLSSMLQILSYNEQRKELVAQELEVLRNEGPVRDPYVYVSSARSGVLGLLAQNLMTDTGLPTFVLQAHPDGSYSGSGRCPSWFPFLDLTDAYVQKHRKEAQNGFVWSGGGHNPAFGISVPNEGALDALVEFLDFEIPRRKPAEEEAVSGADLVLGTVDGCAFGLESDVFDGYLQDLEQWRPFGAGFPEPVFDLKFRRFEAEFSTMSNGKHLRVDLPSGFRLVCFSQGYLFPKDADPEDCFGQEITARVTISMNTFRGVSTIQFVGSITDGFVVDIDT